MFVQFISTDVLASTSRQNRTCSLQIQSISLPSWVTASMCNIALHHWYHCTFRPQAKTFFGVQSASDTSWPKCPKELHWTSWRMTKPVRVILWFFEQPQRPPNCLWFSMQVLSWMWGMPRKALQVAPLLHANLIQLAATVYTKEIQRISWLSCLFFINGLQTSWAPPEPQPPATTRNSPGTAQGTAYAIYDEMILLKIISYGDNAFVGSFGCDTCQTRQSQKIYFGWQWHIFANFNNVEARTVSQCTLCDLPFMYRLFPLIFVASLAKPNEYCVIICHIIINDKIKTLGTHKNRPNFRHTRTKTKKGYKSQRQFSAWNRFVLNKWTSLKRQRNAFATFDNIEASTASQCTLRFSPFKCRIFLFTFVARFCTT